MLTTEHYFAYSSSSFWSRLELASNHRSEDVYGYDTCDDAGKKVCVTKCVDRNHTYTGGRFIRSCFVMFISSFSASTNLDVE